MIDHVGVPVSDYARSKAFYERLFAPLGASLVMEVTPEQTGDASWAAGFGRDGKPSFWIGNDARGVAAHTHVAFVADSRAKVDAFHAAGLAAGGRITTPTTTARSSPIPTDTMWKRCAICRDDALESPPLQGEGWVGMV